MTETSTNPQTQTRAAAASQAPLADMGQANQDGADLASANGQTEINGFNNSRKRKRNPERQQGRELQSQTPTQTPQQQAQQKNQTQTQQQKRQQQAQIQQNSAAWGYAQQSALDPPKRVVVEGALTKEDWMEIVGSDARLRALESKVERIEVICSQNNKLLLQLVQNQNKERNEEERVPVHLDAEFERDYL